MKVLSSVKTLTPRILLAWFLMTLTSWWVINSFVTLFRNGQGWESLAISAVLLFYAAKVFPQNYIVRSFFRAIWAKA